MARRTITIELNLDDNFSGQLRNIRAGLDREVAGARRGVNNLVGGAVAGIAFGVTDAIMDGIGNAMGMLSNQFQAAIDREVSDLAGANTLMSLGVFDNITDATAGYSDLVDTLAEEAKALPGTTEDYIRIQAGIADNLILAFEEAGIDAEKGLKDAAKNLVPNLGVAQVEGNLQTTDIDRFVNRYLSNGLTGEVKGLNFFTNLPTVASKLEENLLDFADNEAGRLDALDKTLKEVYTLDYKLRLSDSLSGVIESLNTQLFGRGGLFDFGKDVFKDIEGDQNVLDEVKVAITQLFGEDGILANIAAIFGLDMDSPMQVVWNAIHSLNDWLLRVNDTFKQLRKTFEGTGLSNITKLSSITDNIAKGVINFGKSIGKVILDMFDNTLKLATDVDTGGLNLGSIIGAWLGTMFGGVFGGAIGFTIGGLIDQLGILDKIKNGIASMLVVEENGSTALTNFISEGLGKIGALISRTLENPQELVSFAGSLIKIIGSALKGIGIATVKFIQDTDWGKVFFNLVKAGYKLTNILREELLGLIPVALGFIGESIIAIIKGIGGLITGFISAALDSLGFVGNMIRRFFESVTAPIRAIFALVTGDIDGLKSIASTEFNKLISPFKAFFNAISNGISSLVDMLPNWVKKFIPGIKTEEVSADIPKVDIPSMDTPNINTPDVNIPDVKVARKVVESTTSLPDITTPSVSIPNIDTPTIANAYKPIKVSSNDQVSTKKLTTEQLVRNSTVNNRNKELATTNNVDRSVHNISITTSADPEETIKVINNYYKESQLRNT